MDNPINRRLATGWSPCVCVRFCREIDRDNPHSLLFPSRGVVLLSAYEWDPHPFVDIRPPDRLMWVVSFFLLCQWCTEFEGWCTQVERESNENWLRKYSLLNVPHHQIDLVGLNGDEIPEGLVNSWLFPNWGHRQRSSSNPQFSHGWMDWWVHRQCPAGACRYG